MPQKLDFSIKKGSSLTSCFCQHLDVIGGKSCFLRQIASQANQSPYLRYDSFWLLLLGIPSILLAKLLFTGLLNVFTFSTYVSKKSLMYGKVIICLKLLMALRTDVNPISSKCYFLIIGHTRPNIFRCLCIIFEHL